MSNTIKLPPEPQVKEAKEENFYVAITGFGWAFAATPWEAMALVPWNYEDKKPKATSKEYAKATKAVQIWHCRESDCAGFEYFRPIDENGDPIGTVIYPRPANATPESKLNWTI